MPYTKVYIHFVWSTKNRFPFLDSFALRQKVWNHIKENAQSKRIFIDAVNGHKEHCHCLLRLDISQTMSGVMQLIKGESSFWINKHNVCGRQRFQWQEEYYAISVSESLVPSVRGY